MSNSMNLLVYSSSTYKNVIQQETMAITIHIGTQVLSNVTLCHLVTVTHHLHLQGHAVLHGLTASVHTWHGTYVVSMATMLDITHSFCLNIRHREQNNCNRVRLTHTKSMTHMQCLYIHMKRKFKKITIVGKNINSCQLLFLYLNYCRKCQRM